jgi:hypothetical protein
MLFAEATCGTSAVTRSLFLSDCGGHASPWHYHTSLNCAINSSYTWLTLAAASGHSPIAGVMLDGRGLYGPYESAGARPSNLDACGGHTGPVPAYSATINGAAVTVPAASSVYHYHVQSGGPFTIGCFGPVASVAAAKVLYPAGCGGASGACSAAAQLSGGCGSGYTWTACTSKGALTGYLLPWDQLAIWAITVGSNMARATPILGYEGPGHQLLTVGGNDMITDASDARFGLLGARFVGEETLNRFYVLHCIAIPLAVALLLAIHFWRVRKDGGISGPL